MSDLLVPFLFGWFGSVWWPGIERDAPPKGPLPEPWWWRLLVGIISGIAAIAVARVSSNPMPGIASSDPMPGVVLGIATGCVAGKIVGALRDATGTR